MPAGAAASTCTGRSSATTPSKACTSSIPSASRRRAGRLRVSPLCVVDHRVGRRSDADGGYPCPAASTRARTLRLPQPRRSWTTSPPGRRRSPALCRPEIGRAPTRGRGRCRTSAAKSACACTTRTPTFPAASITPPIFAFSSAGAPSGCAGGARHHDLAASSGIVFAVRSMQIDFLGPARIDDLLSVETHAAIGGAHRWSFGSESFSTARRSSPQPCWSLR